MSTVQRVRTSTQIIRQRSLNKKRLPGPVCKRANSPVVIQDHAPVEHAQHRGKVGKFHQQIGDIVYLTIPGHKGIIRIHCNYVKAA